MAPEALVQLNRLRREASCSLMEAIGYVVNTIRENIGYFEVMGRNQHGRPRGRIESVRRISNLNYKTERNELIRDGYHVFGCEVLNNPLSDSTVCVILRLEGLRERTQYSGKN